MGSCVRHSRFFVPFVLFVVAVVSCAFWGECRSLQHITLAASTSFPIPHFAKGSPVYPCQSIFLLWRPNPDAGNHRVSFPVPGGPFLNPFSFTRTRGAFPLSGSRAPSFFVCLRGPSCNFVDSSFLSLFQAKINKMLDVSSTRLFTLHSPLSTVVSGSRAGAVLHHGGKETLRPGL